MSTGKFTQYDVITSMGKESEKEWLCVYIYMHTYKGTALLCCMPEMTKTLYINYTPIKFKKK